VRDGGLTLTPISFSEACKFTGYNHRHSQPPPAHKFSIGLEATGKLVGVVMVSRPPNRNSDDGVTLEVRRLTTDGTKNACSKLYGAATRAAFAMGYQRVITYTLSKEGGSSLRAAGFIPEAETTRKPSWGIRAGRWGQQLRLDGREAIPSGNKIRWSRMAV
jgi:hypothetical protein